MKLMGPEASLSMASSSSSLTLVLPVTNTGSLGRGDPPLPTPVLVGALVSVLPLTPEQSWGDWREGGEQWEDTWSQCSGCRTPNPEPQGGGLLRRGQSCDPLTWV